MDIQAIKAAIRETRREMRARGIKRTSCFNAGLSSEVYRLNARMFELETKLERAQSVCGVDTWDALGR